MRKRVFFYYFFIIYLIFVCVSLLYYLNFFLLPKDYGFVFSPIKFIYIVIVSLFFGYYLTLFLFYQKREFKILVFLSFVFVLFYLQDFKRNFIFSQLFEVELPLYSSFEILSCILSILLISIVCYFQVKKSKSRKKSVIINKKSGDDLFV